MTKYTKSVVIAAALVGMLTIESCKKYDDGPALSLRSKKARLTGEWEVVDIENTSGYYDDVEYIFEFEKNGDFEIKISYSTYSYTEEGDWEFSNDKEELELDFDGAGGDVDFEIKRLTNKELIWEDEDGREWELEAI